MKGSGWCRTFLYRSRGRRGRVDRDGGYAVIMTRGINKKIDGVFSLLSLAGPPTLLSKVFSFQLTAGRSYQGIGVRCLVVLVTRYLGITYMLLSWWWW